MNSLLVMQQVYSSNYYPVPSFETGKYGHRVPAIGSELNWYFMYALIRLKNPNIRLFFMGRYTG
jgi:hypothetical protein